MNFTMNGRLYNLTERNSDGILRLDRIEGGAVVDRGACIDDGALPALMRGMDRDAENGLQPARILAIMREDAAEQRTA
jgi:hypothetical protein